MSAEFQTLSLEIPPELAGKRLDAALAQLLPQHSRTRIKAWIDAGQVSVARLPCRPKDLVIVGSRIDIKVPDVVPPSDVLPEHIALDVIYEDRDVLVIDKPAGLVVHPGAGNREHTLQNALLGRNPALSKVARAGIVHRLDKDTSGLLVVAQTPEAQTALSRQLLARAVSREYRALCVGTMTGGGTIDEPIGRHRSDRLRMTVREDGRPAITHYRIVERFRGHTLLNVKLETGRTHQIRLHLSHLHYPIVGDPVYGGRLKSPRAASAELLEALHGFQRQALHAAALAFDHPRTALRLAFQSELPADFRALLEILRRDAEVPAS